ncbi:MAG: prepilin-type N-terminal cleavage/methylation domain-containing protein [Luteolibacter sp.]
MVKNTKRVHPYVVNVKPTSKKPSIADGFTLIELLIVIVIIAALTAIGFPLAQKMRARAADTQCISQLHSWANIIGMYSAEHSGAVECRNWNSIGDTNPSVYVTYWSSDETHASGYQELAKMRCCPALKGKDAISGNGNSLTAYTMTDPTGSSAGKKIAGYNLSQIKDPPHFMMMIEAIGGNAYIQTAAEFTSRVKPLSTPAKKRHMNGVVNAILGDFSVRSFTGQEITKNTTLWTTY